MAFQIASVMAALDGSEHAPGVYAVAAGIASRFGARLYVFRALDVPPDIPPAAATHEPDLLPTFLEKQALQELERITSAHCEIRPERPILVPSHQPWRAIVATADQLNVDLIVMGSHAYGGLDRVFGTIAGRVANHAHRNVLIVHKNNGQPLSGQ